MLPDQCACGCTEQLDAFGQLDLCESMLAYLDGLPEECFDEFGILRIRDGEFVAESVYWEGLKAA